MLVLSTDTIQYLQFAGKICFLTQIPRRAIGVSLLSAYTYPKYLLDNFM